MRIVKQLRGINPFQGDIPVTRVPFICSGRPTLPFPHPWNYTEPIQILSSVYYDTSGEPETRKHNRYVSVPGLPYVFVTREPAVIKAILSDTGDKPGQFDRDTAPTDGIARATGADTLLYANGEKWRNQKKLAAPPFTRTTLFQPERFHEFEQTFRKTVLERLEHLKRWQSEKGEQVTQLQLEPEIQAVMLEMLVNNFFGAAVPYDEIRERYVPAILNLIVFMVSDTVVPRFRNFYKRFGAHGAALKRDAKTFAQLTDIALAGRKQGLGLWGQFTSDAPDELLRSNIRVFLAGALEATTSFASWALSHLARAPAIQEQVYNEVRTMTSYNPENLEEAKALNRVLDETLRLTPSLYFLPRRATVDTWVEMQDGRKLRIPAGTHVVLDVWHANRCEEFWGVEASGYRADEFHPERWENLERQGKKPKDILHFGFGYGPRVCPGKFLGMLEVGLVVGAIVKLFRFTAVHQELHPRAGVSTKPADGVLVNLSIRS